MKKVAIIAIASSLTVGGACSDDRFVDRITVVNETGYPARIEVSGDDGAWIPLTTLEPGTEDAVEEVLDVGSTWWFRFLYAKAAEEVRMSRAELAGEDWRVEVPGSFEDELERLGVQRPLDF